jgi:transcriptional regulator with XRE-family HTH domain
MQDRTLQDVASAVGMKENTISAYEKGKIQIPIDSLEAVCSYLGINFIDLLYDVQRQIEEMS